jgi:cytidine deaminase
MIAQTTTITQTTIDDLVQAARAARASAYAPYSRYRVGAAVLTASGRIFSGCNIENASYGLTVCAERVAVWSAVAAGEHTVVAVAVATHNGATPCGACRQVLAEFAPAGNSPEDDMLVIVALRQGQRTLWLFRDLLPNAFRAEHLSKE